jgi:hypothetical protein
MHQKPHRVRWTGERPGATLRAVAELVWIGIGGLLAVLLGVSWWLDRDARRRGATPLRAGAMIRARWQRNLDTERREAQLFSQGATPRVTDAARDIWDGRDPSAPPR